MNIAITGAIDNIGLVLVDNFLRECKPAKIVLSCLDYYNLPT